MFFKYLGFFLGKLDHLSCADAREIDNGKCDFFSFSATIKRRGRLGIFVMGVDHLLKLRDQTKESIKPFSHQKRVRCASHAYGFHLGRLQTIWEFVFDCYTYEIEVKRVKKMALEIVASAI